MVAFHTLDGRFDDVEGGAAESVGGLRDAVDGELSCALFAHDAAFADGLATGFELGLDETDELTLPGGCRDPGRALRGRPAVPESPR